MTFGRRWIWAALFAFAAGCGARIRSTDGNTSWMHACTTNADCDGLDCRCGVCTTACTSDGACGEGNCAMPGSTALDLTCRSSPSNQGICLPKCSANNCKNGAACIGGQCVPPPPRSSDGATDGGMAGRGGTASLGVGGAVAPPLGSGGAIFFGAGGTVGSTSMDPPLTDCMHIDYSSYAGGETISFRDDVMPMFGLSCVTSDCHSPRDHKAGLNLGYKCAYDANAKWKCTYPATSSAPGDQSMPQPLDPQTIADVYASLMMPSATVEGMVPRVKPGDPANSFLMLKLADQQNSRGYACMNQDPSHESLPPPCGVSMPQNQDLYCQGTYRPRFDAIARWIAEGAPNN